MIPESTHTAAIGDSARLERTLTLEGLQLAAALAADAGIAPGAVPTLSALRGRAFVGTGSWVGAMRASAIATLLPGATPAYRRHDLRFLAPVRLGDRVQLEVRISARDAKTGVFVLHCTATNQDGAALIDGEVEVAPADGVIADDALSPGIQVNVEEDARQLLSHVRLLEPVRAAVVHPCDEASLSAALDAGRAGLLVPVLVAPRAKLDAVASRCRLDLSGVEVIDVPHSHAAADRAVELAGERQVEVLVKGSLHTDELMAAVVARGSCLRTARRISHCFVLQAPGYPRPFIVTDAAINLAPALAHKADIIRNAIGLAHVMGIAQPKVAILAAVETVNPMMPATLDAAALCKMADRGQISGALLDGPLALDNAMSVAAARTKGIVSPVAGQADILVVPDLESGNMLAKQLIYLGGAASAGIAVGARVPIVLTSRADDRAARMASCALALMLAHHYRQSPP